MSRKSIPFKETGQFSGLVDDYLFGNPELKPFYRYAPDLEGLTAKLDQRRKSIVNRELLQARILKQYDRLSAQHDPVLRNINLLSEQNTFTITTGHQLNILTGPLYFTYKIATTIRLAGELTRLHPDCNFIPVYWMASEDHDFDEIRSVRVFGNTLNWIADHKGAVGKFSTVGMEKILEEVSAILGEQLSIPDVFYKAYTQNTNLADATRQLVNDLFGKYGLVVIDGDDRELKRTFVPEMKEELMKMVSSSSVEITNREFSKRYKVQVSPRDINLFYMIDGLRERIINEANDVYIVNNTNLKFSKDELLAELESHPERFSPNVIMRPLYQEKILPNLAYIGGPGELNYWLQLASTFDAFQIPFPVLVLRNCFLLLNSSVRKKMEKFNLNTDDLFSSIDFLTLKVLESSSDLHVGTEIQSGVIQKSFDELNRTYSQLDSTLAASVEAERQKVLNSLKSLEEKARRLLKKKNETVVGQVKTLKEQLLPGGSLQERTDNILSYSNGDPEKFIDFILSNTNPFEKDFVILDLP